jgi:hypothetical protein
VTTVGYKVKRTQAAPALVRQSTQWFFDADLADGPSTTPEFSYGTKPLVPFAGDWDGDGTRTAGFFNAGVFHLRATNDPTSSEETFTFGDARGFVVVGDWNGDGLDDVAVYRNGLWQTRLTGCGTTGSFNFGTGTWPTAVPVAGDWDGDGVSGIGIFTPATGQWSIRNTPSGGPAEASYSFPGIPGSYPVTGDWDDNGTDTIGVKTGSVWTVRNANASGPIGSPGDIQFTYGQPNDLPVVWGYRSIG